MSAVARRRWEMLPYVCTIGGPMPTLTGKVLIGVRQQHTPASQGVHEGRLTLASCSYAVRNAGKPGDVGLIVGTGKSKFAANRGMQSANRLLLMAFIVSEDSMTVPKCFSSQAPDWTQGRRDRVYMVRVKGGTPMQAHRKLARFLNTTEDDTLARATVKKCPGEQSWAVSYPAQPGTTLIFQRKVGRNVSGLHEVEGVNAVSNERRATDFKGRCLVSERFVILPGLEADPNAISWASLKVNATPGRGVRTTSLDENPTLRTWVMRNLL